MNMKNHCVVSKLHSDFVLFPIKVLTSTFDKNIRLFTSNFSVQAPRRACKFARHGILRRLITAAQRWICGRFLKKVTQKPSNISHYV
jgi:hypothetical protein